jgi:hypothetical protein
MHISSSVGQGGRIKEMNISAESGENLAPFKSFFDKNKWIRMDEEGKLRTAPYFKSVPKPKTVYDKDVAPLWTKGPVELKKRSGKGDGTCGLRSFYVQHIGGYDGDYRKKAQRMVLAGFSVLRSRRGSDGKFWEIWYLSGEWAAEGEIRGKNEKQILSWLRHEIVPGEIVLSGGHWGLRHPED